MKYYATKPLHFNENDLGNFGAKEDAKDLSFSVEDVEKMKVKTLPDCAFVQSFVKQGILVEVKNKEK